MNSIYYKELSNIPTLSKEEQLALVTKAKAGDNNAMERLIKSYLKLVVYYAKQLEKYLPSDDVITIDDLISEGNVALIDAINGYNTERHTTLSYYAGVVVKRRMTSFIMQHNTTIRVPERKMKELIRLSQALDTDEVSQGAGDKVYFPMKISLPNNHQFADDYDNEHGIWEEVELALNELKPREKKVLEWYYGLNNRIKKSQSEIGRELGLSKMRISQIISLSIKNIIKTIR